MSCVYFGDIGFCSPVVKPKCMETTLHVVETFLKDLNSASH